MFCCIRFILYLELPYNMLTLNYIYTNFFTCLLNNQLKNDLLIFSFIWPPIITYAFFKFACCFFLPLTFPSFEHFMGKFCYYSPAIHCTTFVRRFYLAPAQFSVLVVGVVDGVIVINQGEVLILHAIIQYHTVFERKKEIVVFSIIVSSGPSKRIF